MDKPDKIWANTGGNRQTWLSGVNGNHHTPYLLSTPERELASELVAIVRKSLTYHSDEAEYQDELCCDEGAAYHKRRVKEISAVLDKLEGKG